MNERIRNASRAAVTFGGAAAAINLVRNLPIVITLSLPPSFFILVASISFATFGGGAFVLALLGVTWVAPKSPAEPIVSTWFVWMIAVALAGFVICMALKLDLNSLMRWGSLGAGVWIVSVLLMWIVSRMRAGKRSDLTARGAE